MRVALCASPRPFPGKLLLTVPPFDCAAVRRRKGFSWLRPNPARLASQRSSFPNQSSEGDDRTRIQAPYSVRRPDSGFFLSLGLSPEYQLGRHLRDEECVGVD